MSTRNRKRRPEARPHEIARSALELFSERGFAATRLEDVAARAGLSKAAIYLYFPDKAALLNAVVREIVDANVEGFRELVANHHGPVTPLLEKLVFAFAQRITGTPLPHLIKLIISEARAQPELGRLYLETAIGRLVPIVQSIIERGIASGEFRAVDAALTVRCLIGPMLLAALWRSVFEPIGGARLDVEALARQHIDLMTRGLVAHTREEDVP